MKIFNSTLDEKINQVKKFKKPCALLHHKDFYKLFKEYQEEFFQIPKMTKDYTFFIYNIECFINDDGEEGKIIFVDKAIFNN